jgi:hypothetical protein
MTKLLEQAIERLRQLPDDMQNTAARALIMQFEENPEPGDRHAIENSRIEFEDGQFVTLDEWRHDMGLGDH